MRQVLRLLAPGVFAAAMTVGTGTQERDRADSPKDEDIAAQIAQLRTQLRAAPGRPSDTEGIRDELGQWWNFFNCRQPRWWNC